MGPPRSWSSVLESSPLCSRTCRRCPRSCSSTWPPPSASSTPRATADRHRAVSHPVLEIKQPGRRPLFVELREPLEIGRECDGVLIADGQASRRHANFAPRGETVVVEDLGSTNGTRLDGNRISSPVVLMAGAVLQVGDTTVELGRAVPNAVQPAAGAPFGARETSVSGGGGAAAFGGAVKAGASGPLNARETSMDAVARAVEQAPSAIAVVEHDHGTITIVFSDIENSTSRATSMGDAAWMKVLGEHNRIITRHVEKWNGTVVKNQGDGFMLTFNGARQALRAMIDVPREQTELEQRDPERGVPLRDGELGRASCRERARRYG